MKSLWNDNEASNYKNDLALRVYTSRLLGQDKSLVLHGGGNTSVKMETTNIYGEKEEILYVKGSGWDLETIEEPGLSPVRLEAAKKLATLETLSDPQMVNELKTSMSKYSAPTPSVEAILHAIIPYKYVDHTHADAIVSVTNTPDGEKHIREIYGDTVVVIPYVMPGFDLARLCAIEFEKQRNDKTVGMVLLQHGMFSFADTAKESYENMIELIHKAEEFLASKNAWVKDYDEQEQPAVEAHEIAELRYDLSQSAGFPMLVKTTANNKTLSFAGHPEIERISQQGPATPDHIIRTKMLPMLGFDVEFYLSRYVAYFSEHSPNSKDPKTMLDPAPRVILDEKYGMLTAGKTAKETAIVAEIYDHTIDIIHRAETLGGYKALDAQDLFEMEYWDLEQAKLKKGGSPPPFQGEVVFITGAASGIGKACVDEFLKLGAAVVGLDLNEEVLSLYERPDFLGIRCDITDADELERAIEATTLQFGGIDMLVLNAGIFPKSSPISEMDLEQWEQVININLNANLRIMKMTHPLLKKAPRYGRVVIIGSKNVPAPGPGASAYSASKAGLNQLARVAALEWGSDGIRINSIHPNAVFDTGIWTDEVLTNRAKSYGLSVEEYKKNNVLKTEVTSQNVAQLAADMCGKNFEKTTASAVPIDGGNERVI